MKPPLTVISEFGGCPTDSYIAAIQHLAQQDLSKEDYEARIQQVIGLEERPVCESWFYARSLFMYCVQETIREFNAGLVPPLEEAMNDIYQTCIEKTEKFIVENPWNETRFNIQHGLSYADDEFNEDGEPILITKKGAKKDVTEKIFKDLKSAGASRQKIIDTFIEQVGMSRAGATTYFHSLKKEFGFSEKDNPNTQSAKTESKQELAERLYKESTDKSKATLIALFTEKLSTSKLGAQTYFYLCKRKYEKN